MNTLTKPIVTNLAQLYEQDFNLWIQSTVKSLRERQFEQIDFENLIEEIESMGRSDKRAIRSNLEIILIHLLKWIYQPEKRTSSWESSIREHRKRIEEILEDSPSLRNYLTEVFAQCYTKARKEAAYETRLSIDIFPIDCTLNEIEVLNLDFLPN